MTSRDLKTYRPHGVISPFDHNRRVHQRKQFRRLVRATHLALAAFQRHGRNAAALATALHSIPGFEGKAR